MFETFDRLKNSCHVFGDGKFSVITCLVVSFKSRIKSVQKLIQDMRI
jgi:hypothetical protein